MDSDAISEGGAVGYKTAASRCRPAV